MSLFNSDYEELVNDIMGFNASNEDNVSTNVNSNSEPRLNEPEKDERECLTDLSLLPPHGLVRAGISYEYQNPDGFNEAIIPTT